MKNKAKNNKNKTKILRKNIHSQYELPHLFITKQTSKMSFGSIKIKDNILYYKRNIIAIRDDDKKIVFVLNKTYSFTRISRHYLEEDFKNNKYKILRVPNYVPNYDNLLYDDLLENYYIKAIYHLFSKLVFIKETYTNYVNNNKKCFLYNYFDNKHCNYSNIKSIKKDILYLENIYRDTYPNKVNILDNLLKNRLCFYIEIRNSSWSNTAKIYHDYPNNLLNFKLSKHELNIVKCKIFFSTYRNNKVFKNTLSAKGISTKTINDKLELFNNKTLCNEVINDYDSRYKEVEAEKDNNRRLKEKKDYIYNLNNFNESNLTIYPHYTKFSAIRFNQDKTMVETSNHASVPVLDAKRIYSVFQQTIKKLEGGDINTINLKRIRIGNYIATAINCYVNENLTRVYYIIIGCHYIDEVCINTFIKRNNLDW